MKIALLGYGNVGKTLSRLLESKRATFPFQLVGIHTARHGSAFNPKGLGLSPMLVREVASVDEFLDRAQPEVLLEMSTLNPESGEPAISHIRSAFARKIHVITANIDGALAFNRRGHKVLGFTGVLNSTLKVVSGIKIGWFAELNATQSRINVAGETDEDAPGPTSMKRLIPRRVNSITVSLQRTGLGICSTNPWRADSGSSTKRACQLLMNGNDML